MGTAATSCMIPPQDRELLLRSARKYDPDIIDATGDER